MKIKPKELKAIMADYESRSGDPLDPDEKRVAAVKCAISKLPLAERTVFILHIDGYSFRTLATMLNVSRETLRKYYGETLEKIKREVESCLK